MLDCLFRPAFPGVRIAQSSIYYSCLAHSIPFRLTTALMRTLMLTSRNGLCPDPHKNTAVREKIGNLDWSEWEEDLVVFGYRLID